MESLEQQLTIKQYRAIKKIGQGALVTVYLAFDQTNHRLCTIKLQKIDHNEVKKCKSNQAFINEISALKRAKHPFIIELLDSFYWEYQTQVFLWVIVLEHADGGDLYDSFIKISAPATEKQAITWLAEVSLALAHLNNLNLFQLDLNPQSIVIIGEKMGGLAKIGEMGFIPTDSFDNDGKVVSASRYYAPEQLNEVAHTKKNCWSLGIVFYELLTGGQQPFEIYFNSNIYLTRLPRLELRQSSLVANETKELLKITASKIAQ
ncbi:hypothetical protein FGO68_gene16595 [Halteria grandinella]|uniref:Protein kinase domain-containing protein n=1 Tax=Halteria grandinella TaxID=5974 RepID=A0A8J8T3V0_HALGN|nr:hypothetical protein FGO68_gene16595 [Halteria grandinella]